MGIALLTTALPRSTWIDTLVLAMPLGLIGYVGGPLILAGWLGIAAIGWKRRES
jgi:hypothetical protein